MKSVKVKPVKEIADYFDETTSLVPEENEKKEKNDERCRILMSALHKFVRRSMPLQAMMAAYDLYLLRPYQCMGELRTISIEDVAQPLEIIASEILFRQIKETAATDKNLLLDGKNLLRVMDVAKILAEAQKDRRADELFHLCAGDRVHRTPESEQLLSKLREYPDYIFDMHTTEGRRLGRKYKHFVEVASVCTNKSQAYDEWREIWESIVNKDWTGSIVKKE